ncbi:3-hydroxyacyl-CoA dehydrogenase family protein [Advenella mimigardefordensis]|uniref:3-hydroxybutyryl-CoA dehydrogenase n=1 Tax=Advenella mimigardefordensis (strain DSM 17166 / LMG 22922 / DPN7) TaxID=1247726 RepID=W0PFT1_ADVMD|nr:3-hydroxyacyl-CoA dehydrogenase family protein [Advenella mimigardefordensis]AHG64145.1 3-hydroxybutyryl-CoA dehydrogenase [Advenella mimigardefordensis DPN7]
MSEIKTVGVVGSGTMGTGIAIVIARAGFKTIVLDTREEALENARQQAAGFLQKSVARGKLKEGQDVEIMQQWTGTTRAEDLAECDLVIEAIFEDLKVKHELFSKLDKICPPHTLFASNTSTISITEIAGGSGRPDKVAGMHFCLPAQLMKLVEMSPGLTTSDETSNRLWAFTEALGQKPVKTRDTPGFILNYFLIPWHNDVINMVDQGVAEPADIDRAVKTALGYPLGPLELLDMVGMDTQKLLSEAMYGLTNEPRAACPTLVKRMIGAGKLGRKTGEGFHSYQNNKIFGA